MYGTDDRPKILQTASRHGKAHSSLDVEALILYRRELPALDPH